MIPRYRAFYKANQKMYEVLTLDIIDEKVLIENNDNPKRPLRGYVKITETELMQYTGLKDKNGTEIYEGDICRWTDPEAFEGEIISDIFVVRYSDEFLKWIGENNNSYYDLYDFIDDRQLELIGNIYEDPELLKEVEE